MVQIGIFCFKAKILLIVFGINVNCYCCGIEESLKCIDNISIRAKMTADFQVTMLALMSQMVPDYTFLKFI